MGRRSANLLLSISALLTFTAACGGAPQTEENSPPPGEEEPGFEMPAEPKFFDECRLLLPEDFDDALDTKPHQVTARSVRQTERGWSSTCGYMTGDSLGAYTSSVEVTTDTTSADFEASQQTRPRSGLEKYPDAKPREVAQLGDDAWTQTTYVPVVGRDNSQRLAPQTVDVHVLQGTVAIVVRLHVAKDAKPDVPAAIELARTAHFRLPDPLRVEPKKIEQPCTKVDLKLAGTVLGAEEFSGQRSVRTNDRKFACDFTARGVALSIISGDSSEDSTNFEASKAGGQALDGIGDQAYYFGSPMDGTFVKVGDQVLSIFGVNADQAAETGTDGAGPGSGGGNQSGTQDPTEDELAFLRSVADALT
ncbi:hypothetical protein ABN028_25730 [Actinopolymorpha sp. B17G11]|uniref:hypothetical protein n=1 Tax=Actinopolymorpha sp. B17G11 TaxID=3160861 RepID=UPI0032E4FF7C